MEIECLICYTDKWCTYNQQLVVNLLRVIEVSVLVDHFNLPQNFLFIFLFDQGTGPTALLSQVTSDRLVEVDKVDD